MVLKMYFLILLLCLSAACKVTEKESASSQVVEGTYVHTYSAEVIDPATGEIMGTRTVRDSIFIKKAGEKFEVSNQKWLDDDFDNEGWVRPESKEDQPIPPYIAEYDSSTKILVPDPKERKPVPLYIAGDFLYWGEEKALEYRRVDED